MGTRIECARIRCVQTSAQSGLDNSYTSWLRGLLHSYNVLSKRSLKGAVARLCGILISGPVNRFSSFRSWNKISFHRPVSVREHRLNLVKKVFDHFWAILAVYLCIFFFKL